MTRERHWAERRLRRLEEAVQARLAAEGPRIDRGTLLDSERFAAPLLERLGVRGRVQLVLWGSMTLVFTLALVSFFSAPLMDADVAISGGLVAMMLILSYVI